MTVFTPQYVNAAKPGKKYGNVKMADGTQYLLPAGMESAFQSGVPVDVPLKTETWGVGADAKTVQIINGRPSGTMLQADRRTDPPPPQAGIQASSQAYTQPSGTITRISDLPQAGGAARQAVVDRDVLITTTALMKSYIEAGQHPLTEIDHLMVVCLDTARKMVRAASGL